MSIMYITDKQYILDNYRTLQFYSHNKVELVRNYLEQECGFRHSIWKTEEHECLNWLCVLSNMSVEGNIIPRSDLVKCNIDYLLGIIISDIEVCKPINLKE